RRRHTSSYGDWSSDVCSSDLEAIRSSLTKRVLDLLARLAKDEPQKYATFWKEFGAVLKEGIAQDLPNQGAILPLLRFASTHASRSEERRVGKEGGDGCGEASV